MLKRRVDIKRKKDNIYKKMNTKELFLTKCEKDYKSRHFWESIGVVGINPTYQVYKCSQCEKIIHEPLEELGPSNFFKKIIR